MKIKVDQETGMSYISIKQPNDTVEALTIYEYYDLIFDIDKNNTINLFEILSNDIIPNFNNIDINIINDDVTLKFSLGQVVKKINLPEYWLKLHIWNNNKIIQIILEKYKNIDLIKHDLNIEYIS